MKRCWAAQLQVLEDFDAVCSRHSLKWFAFCGTLLGAVRHKGFIPWDDDMDVCMLRGDYNLFLQYAAKEMPGYFVETYDRQYPEDGFYTDGLGITRINNIHKADFNPPYLDAHHRFPYTVGLDVYPMDYVPRNSEEYRTIIEINKFILSVCFRYKSLNWERYSIPDGAYAGIDLDQAYDSIYRATGVKIDKRGDVLRQLNDLAVRLSSYTKSKDADMVACMAHMTTGHPHMIFPKKAFSKSIEIPFEKGSVYAPAGYDEVLSINYGKGYMKPVNASPHEYPYYKQQERWVRDHVIKNPEYAEDMPAYYIMDVYDEDPEKKTVLDQIYRKEQE